MNLRSRVTIYILGVVMLFGVIFLLWAIDTHKIGIFADTETTTYESARELKQLPSPDQSIFNRMYTTLARLFTK